MKTHLKYAMCMMVVLLLCCCSKQQLSDDARASIQPGKIDFGTIAANDPIAFHEVSLSVRNMGKQELKIEDVELPEGLSYKLLPRNTIEGGGKATLKIVMDVRGFSGTVSESAYLVSNDPSNPRLPIMIEAVIAGEREEYAPEIPDEPDIVFDHKIVEMGVVDRRQMVKHEFPFRNEGRKTLVFHSMETTCICFTGTVTAREISPGGSAAIIARFEPYLIGGTSYLKSITVRTNDPDEPVITLSMTATVVDETVLEPKRVLLPDIPLGEPASAQVNLIQEGKADLHIKEIQSSSSSISVDVSPLEGERKGYLLNVKVSSDMPEGQFDEVVTIFTNYKDHLSEEEQEGRMLVDYSKLRLPVKGSVSDVIAVVPHKLNLGSVMSDTTARRKLIVSSATSSFEIRALSIADSRFHVSQSTVEPGKKYEVTVEFVPDAIEGQVNANLIIETTGASLTVPVFATVKPSS